MVGRDRPYAELVALLAGAGAGHGRAALIRGDAGMGKTTLVESIAGSASMSTVWGWCSADQTEPYLPWRPLFDHVGIAPPDAAGGEELGRRRLFAAVVDALRRTGPLLLVLEDLHWADPPSLRLLRVVAEALPRTPVCLLATVRDDPLETGGTEVASA